MGIVRREVCGGGIPALCEAFHNADEPTVMSTKQSRL